MNPRKHMAKDFEQGALVWAKMKGFSPWPAQVSFPSDGKIPKSKTPQHFVVFFGTKDYAWIPDQHIVPHSEDMLANSRRYKKLSSSMKSAILEIKYASQNIAKRVKLLTKDKIKKEPVSSPPPLESTPDKPKAPKRKRISKKILKPKVLSSRGTRKIKLLKKDEIKKEPVNSSPPPESTVEKSNSRKRKRTSKTVKPTRRTQRCGKKIAVLKKDKIKKELIGSSPPPESTVEKSNSRKRKRTSKTVKPTRRTQRCGSGKKIAVLKKDQIKKEQVSSLPLRESTPKKPKTIKRKPKMMKPERTTKRCEKLRKDKIKKELSSPPLPERPPLPKRKLIPKQIIKSTKKIAGSDMMSKDVDKDIKIKKDEDSDEDSDTDSDTDSDEDYYERDYMDSDEDFALLLANVPPYNEYPNVAVIPPYNDDPNANASTSRMGEVPDPVASGSERFTATYKKIGFLGLGEIGYLLVNNLITTGHNVTIWNRTISDKYHDIVQKGANTAKTPAEVIRKCDVTFCCVSGPEASRSVLFSNNGVLSGLNELNSNKDYVELTTIDPDTSRAIHEAVVGKGGRYLEAQIVGSRQHITGSTMVILASGDRKLFTDCNATFPFWARHAFFMGFEVGQAAKINLILSMLAGTTFVALGEALALGAQCGISPKSLMEIISEGPINFPLLMERGRAIANNDETVSISIKNQQKDMSLAVALGHATEQPLTLAVAANEAYKRAKPRFGDCDVSLVQKCYL